MRWLLRDEIVLVDGAGERLGAIPIAGTTFGSGFGGVRETASGGHVLAGSVWVPDEPRRFPCENTSGGTCLRLAFGVMSIGSDGAPDVAFGDGGIAITDLPEPYGAQGTGAGSVVTAPAGRITVAGTACQRPFVCDLVVLRYGAP